MKTNQVVCPLCGEKVPAEELKFHYGTEKREIQDFVIGNIKDRHPEWVAEDGACRRCWEYYKNL